MEYPKLITPEEGQEYMNHNGQAYRCIEVLDAETAVLERLSDKWTLIAHRTRQYTDGTIEWDQSTGGHWPIKTIAAQATKITRRR